MVADSWTRRGHLVGVPVVGCRSTTQVVGLVRCRGGRLGKVPTSLPPRRHGPGGRGRPGDSLPERTRGRRVGTEIRRKSSIGHEWGQKVIKIFRDKLLTYDEIVKPVPSNLVKFTIFVLRNIKLIIMTKGFLCKRKVLGFSSSHLSWSLFAKPR